MTYKGSNKINSAYKLYFERVNWTLNVLDDNQKKLSKNKTFSESVSELKEQKLLQLKIRRDILLEPTRDAALEAFETGVELSQAVKDERDAVRKKYDDDFKSSWKDSNLFK